MIKNEYGQILFSVRPVPIVMISDEEDSLSVSIAAERSRVHAKNTIDDIHNILQGLQPGDRPSSVLLIENRMFDVDIKYCALLIDMIDKVCSALKEELGFDQSKATDP